MGIGLLNIRVLIEDAKKLLAAADAGNWLGDGGVADVVSEILGVIAGNRTGSARVAAFACPAMTDAEIDAELGNLTRLYQARKTQLCGATADGKVGSFDPNFWLGLIDVVGLVIQTIQNWRKGVAPAA